MKNKGLTVVSPLFVFSSTTRLLNENTLYQNNVEVFF